MVMDVTSTTHCEADESDKLIVRLLTKEEKTRSDTRFAIDVTNNQETASIWVSKEKIAILIDELKVLLILANKEDLRKLLIDTAEAPES